MKDVTEMVKAPTIPRPYLSNNLPVLTPSRDDVPEGTLPPEYINAPDGVLPDEFLYHNHRYMSLTKLAASVGISVSHLSRIMHRQRAPSFQVAINLAAVMSCSLDALAARLGVHPNPRLGA